MSSQALILRGDARALPLPDASVDCIVTSPPYYLARDYADGGESMVGQIGQEPTPEQYLATLADVLAECWRVLRPAGTCWVNLADTYSGKANGGASVGRSGRGDHVDVIPKRVNTTHLAPYKSLLQLPERFSIAATDAGWCLRNRIVWWKRNGMRHPVTDRFVNLHEVLFLLTKSPRYFFDLDAVREPLSHPNALDGTRVWGGANKAMQGRTGAGVRTTGRRYGHTKFVDDRPGRRGHGGGSPERNTHPLGRNPGDAWNADEFGHVWDIPTSPSPDPHYAPFPVAIARRCILAGTQTGGRVLDPFGGTGTVAMTAAALGRVGISADLGQDYSRIALRRVADPAQIAKALGVPKPPAQLDGQTALFDEGVA